MTRKLYPLLGAALVVTAIVLFVIVPGLAAMAKSHYAMGFPDDYDALARSIASGEGYRLGPQLDATMMREPGYPIFLAGVFKVLGDGLPSARLANLLLAAITALLLSQLALRVTRDPTAAVVAAMVFLLHPGTVVAEARGGSEILFTLAIVAFVLLLYRALERGRTGLYFLAGLALGVAVLIRSTPMLFPLVLLPYLWLAAPAGARWRRLAQGGVVLVGMGLAMSPWIARNFAVSGQFVPTATVQGVAAQEGQYTCERLSFGRGFQGLQDQAAAERDRIASQLGLGLRSTGTFYQYFHTLADEQAFNRALLERTYSRYRESPGLLAGCVGANLFHFWFLGKNGLASALNVALQLPLLVLAVVGLALVARRRPVAAWGPVVLFVASIVAVHLPILAHARHAIPLTPFLGAFAAVAIVAAWRGFMAPRETGRDARVAALSRTD